MGEKHAVLIKSYHVVEVEEEELIKENGILDKVIMEISKDQKLNIGEEVLMKWEGTFMIPLIPELTNCGKCAGCGVWTTDREKDEPIEGLAYGITVDGKLICDECLAEESE